MSVFGSLFGTVSGDPVGYRIDTTLMPGVAAGKAAQAQPATAPDAEPVDGSQGIL